MGFKFEVRRILDRLECKIDSILEKETKIMADLSNLSASVDTLVSVVGTAVTDLQALSAEIAELKAGGTDQAAIDALQAKVDGIAGNLTSAVAQNQP